MESMKRKRTIQFGKWELTAASLAEVEPHQLDHVGLEQVDVPPGPAFHGRHGARFGREEVAGAAVDGPFGHAAQRHARLHRRLARRHVQHCQAKTVARRSIPEARNQSKSNAPLAFSIS